jgi:hypothetical protein
LKNRVTFAIQAELDLSGLSGLNIVARTGGESSIAHNHRAADALAGTLESECGDRGSRKCAELTSV